MHSYFKISTRHSNVKLSVTSLLVIVSSASSWTCAASELTSQSWQINVKDVSDSCSAISEAKEKLWIESNKRRVRSNQWKRFDRRVLTPPHMKTQTDTHQRRRPRPSSLPRIMLLPPLVSEALSHFHKLTFPLTLSSSRLSHTHGLCASRLRLCPAFFHTLSLSFCSSKLG